MVTTWYQRLPVDKHGRRAVRRRGLVYVIAIVVAQFNADRRVRDHRAGGRLLIVERTPGAYKASGTPRRPADPGAAGRLRRLLSEQNKFRRLTVATKQVSRRTLG